MNQLIAVAVGGAFGAVMRFLVASGVQHWLGRDFPYGTLSVNVIGSFLLGLLTEALILQRIALTLEYRSAILVGFIGAFTTFSTFSLDTVYLLQNGHAGKAFANIAISVFVCLLAVWLGLKTGKLSSTGVLNWQDGLFPYALVLINALGALLIGAVAAVLLPKVPLSTEHQLALFVIFAGVFLTLSGLYTMLYLLEHGYSSISHPHVMLIGLTGNTLACLLTMWLGGQIARWI